MAYEPTPDKFGIANFLLLPLSGIYWFGWRVYELIYRFGFKKPTLAHEKIVVIGNLLAGGAGKSPLTRRTAELFIEQGFEVVLGLSGYGSPASKGAQIAPHGPLNSSEFGDEAAMLREFLPQTNIIVGRARVLAAQLCQKNFPNSILLMDDGHQHKPLLKKVSVIVDLESPKNPFVLPAGPYREPRSNLKNAKIVHPRDFELKNLSLEFFDPKTNQMVNAPANANLLCSIARPQRFKNSILGSKVEVKNEVFYPDHFALQNVDWPFTDELPIIVTAKDWVKLKERQDIGSKNVIVAQQRVQISNEEAYLKKLIYELNQ